MKNTVCLILMMLVAACGSTSKKSTNAVAEEPAGWPAPVGQVQLQTDRSPSETLDLGIIIFNPGIPKDESTHTKLGIYPKIREVESKYLPVLLREALVASNKWGVVRVLPQEDQTLEFRVSGEILHSDGINLILRIKATDASGREWLNRVYRDTTTQHDYPALSVRDPYTDIYRQIANDLGAVKSRMGTAELAKIRDIALLRYATDLSPEAFADFLIRDPAGMYQLRRLPAKGDPMMVRVQRIRNQEYLFIDTVDEQFVTLFEEMEPTYYLWRQYGREQVIFKREYQERAANQESYGRSGSFVAMQQTYNAFRKSKELDQGLKETAAGFNNEVAPTVMEVDGRVFRLSGGLDTQYEEWRKILRSIFELETGLPAMGQ